MKVKQKLKIKGKDIPVFIEGEDEGVIAVQTFEIDDPNNIQDMMSMIELEEKLIEEHVEVITEKA